MNDQNYEKKYNKLMASLDDMHKHNVKKMRSALRSLLIVPTIFLILLFMTNSSKTVFLVLWIASLFVIAALLISIEYQDYSLRRMMSEAEDAPEAEELPPPELPDTAGAAAEAAEEEIKAAAEETADKAGSEVTADA